MSLLDALVGAPVTKVVVVHAHPDDETLSTGVLLAELVEVGVQVHLVTATRGERGALMDGVDAPAPGTDEFARYREGELANALVPLGIRHHVYLGSEPARAEGLAPTRYRDSGMEWVREGLAGPAADAGAEAFTSATIDAAAADLVAYLSVVRPDVLISYDAGGGYGHPDHVRTHEVTLAAAQATSTPMLEVIPADRPVDGDEDAVVWIDLWRQLPRAQEALAAHATQVRVDGANVVHNDGRPEPIVTIIGLRRRADAP